MKIKEFYYKVCNKLRTKYIVNNWNIDDYDRYCRKYKSYRHMKKSSFKQKCDKSQFYMTARPNPRAGIGHQMANWIAGYWFSKLFEIPFAHVPFSSVTNPFEPNLWDTFLGLGDTEKLVSDLRKAGWKKVILPLFDEDNEVQLEVIKRIINSYSGRKIIFILEQDQFYRNQYGVITTLQDKFYSACARKNQKLLYSNEEFNIAVHVRRGDIVQKSGDENPNLTMRWLDNDFFVNALKGALKKSCSNKPIRIYIFSQGKLEDYIEFNQFSNVTYCLDMSAKDSFLHMVYADALITSKSSFSYKPALLNRGIKFSPKNFWHGYPAQSDWYMLDDYGNILEDSDE